METVLKVERLTKYFGKRKVIDDLSFEVREGEVYGFLGPNGSGKTTTIKMILGLLEPDAGKIEIAGFDRQKNYEQALDRIGGIVENPDTYGYLSARDNLKIYGRMHSLDDPARIDEVLAMVGLSARAGDKVKRYSLGMKQRLGLAQAVLHRPRVLILDEPTNGLDPVGIRELRDILKKLAHEEGLAVLVSSHLLSEMQLMCDRVCIIDKGRALAVCDVSELMNGKKAAFRLEISPADRAREWFAARMPEKLVRSDENGVELAAEREELPGIVRDLAAEGFDLYLITPVSRTLEDSFLEITGGGNEVA